MTNKELVQKALAIYADKDHWTYVQGGLGETADSSRIKGLYNYYRAKGNSSTCDYTEWLPTYGTAADGKSKQCTDCSNFIQVLLGSGKNAAASYYTNMKDAGDIYTAPIGCILLIPGAHVGIVTKQGVRNADGSFKVEPEAMDFYRYNCAPRNVVYTHGLYTKAVYLTGIDYGTATPVSISATINTPHSLGDTLTAKDFTIKVKMSDGTTLTNPNNWSAWPLKLTADVKTINVRYQNVSCDLTVNYIADIK